MRERSGSATGGGVRLAIDDEGEDTGVDAAEDAGEVGFSKSTSERVARMVR